MGGQRQQAGRLQLSGSMSFGLAFSLAWLAERRACWRHLRQLAGSGGSMAISAASLRQAANGKTRQLEACGM